MKTKILLASFLFLSCSQGSIPKAGTRLVSPFSLAVSGNNLYVADAAAFGEYSTGSLLVYSLSQDGSKTLSATLDITPYATQIAASGNLLALGFVGDNSRIELYRTDNAGIPERVDIKNLSFQNSLSSLSFFSHNGQNYLSVAENGNSVHGKTHVWKVVDNSLQLLFTLPDSLARYGRTELLGFSNAVFDGQRLIAMPSSSQSTLGKVSVIAKEFSVASWKDETDLRVFSAVVVDFNKLTSSFDNAVAYVPMIVQRDETAESKTYRTFFSYAAYDAHSSCASKLYLADEAIIWQSSGWNSIADSVYAATSLTGKVATTVSFSKYHDMTKVPLSVGFSTNVLSMGFVKTNSTCVPVWLRTEARGSGEGNARAWIEGVLNSTSFSQEFGVRGVVSSVVSNDYVYSTSFSNSALPIMKYTNGAFEAVK